MFELGRTVRFCLNDGLSSREAGPAHNTFSAYPPMRGLGRYYELHVVVRGDADARTGYLMNIKRIDAAVREHAIPVLERAVGDPALRSAPFGSEPQGRRQGSALGGVMRGMLAVLRPALDDAVVALTLALTPYYDLTLRSDDMDSVRISQQYEFSAAHRLHVDALSDAENRAVFGKCNNPAGHGHNYRVKVTVRAPIDDAGRVTPVEKLDALVAAHAIDRLDHKHLNVDVPQFADRNPSVENIARVVWDMLAEPLRAIGELEEVGVWETGKTVCTYRGPQGEHARER